MQFRFITEIVGLFNVLPLGDDKSFGSLFLAGHSDDLLRVSERTADGEEKILVHYKAAICSWSALSLAITPSAIAFFSAASFEARSSSAIASI